VMSLKDISTSERVIVSIRALSSYLRNMLLPAGLNAYYPYPDQVSLAAIKYLLPLFLAVLATICAVAYSSRQKIWLAVWSYYVVTLLPVIGILQVGTQSMADRYTYLPSLGPFLIVGIGMVRLFNGRAVEHRLAKTAFISGAALIFLFLSIATTRQIGIWRDGGTLWTSVIEKEPHDVPLAYYNRGVFNYENRRLDKAIGDYSRAIDLAPRYTDAFNNRGIAYDQLGMHDSAIKDFSSAISLAPDDFAAYTNRGIGYRGKGSYGPALEEFNKAISINPDYDLAYVNRAVVYYLEKEYKKALADINKAIELNPHNPNAYLIRQDIDSRIRPGAPSSK
jgi:tetratricopeptide (TPR) repeat protein